MIKIYFVAKFMRFLMRHNDNKFKKSLEYKPVTPFKVFSYLDDKDKMHKFNLYEAQKTVNKGTVIDVHGGAWCYGDKDLNDLYCSYFALNGFNVLSPSYRLISKTNLIGMLKDLFSFFTYIKEHEKELKIDLSKVMLIGDSAGANLVNTFNIINNSKELQEKFNFKHVDLKIDLLVLEHPCIFYDYLGQTGNKEKLTKLTCQGLFHKKDYKDDLSYKLLNAPKIYDFYNCKNKTIIVGSKKDVYYPQTQLIIEELNKRNIDFIYKEYDDEVHVFEVINPYSKNSIEFNKFVLESFINLKEEI